MWPLEQMLSPIRDNISSENPNHNEIFLMERIQKQKIDLLQQRISPAQVNLVRPEIAASWIRSYHYGLDPFHYNQCQVLAEDDFNELLREKDFFIKAAEPYLHQLETMDSNYLIFLTDAAGIILRVLCGNPKVLEQVKEKFQLTPGAVWTEASVGTCSHVMSLLLARPIQLCGPELYLETCSYVLGLLLGNADDLNNPEDARSLNQTSCSSAPVFDACGNLAGSLTIISPYLHHQNAHSLGLAVSTAWAIQNQYQLALNSELLSVTLEAADEAMITINRSGVITKANMMAQKLFNFMGQDLTGMQMEKVFGDQALIQSVLDTGLPVLNSEFVMGSGEQSLRLRSAQAVKDDYGTIFGCVLTFQSIAQLKKPVVSMNSLETKFTFDSIVAHSPQMSRSIHMAQKFARLDANILVQGESGTGKEVFAQAIHNASRPQQPFIAVNCAAIPSSLIESELFGYEGGTFTGAERQGRPGKIELANGGTLFLDEIGDMPLELQPVLLRVLEEKTVMRVGGRRYIPVDFRLITVSNKNLANLVSNKKFREDLYYRLAVFTIHIPPLRERGSDVISLAKYFIKNIAQNQQIHAPVLSDAAIYCLLQYHWPGNIRQLKNALLHAVTMSMDGIIKAEDLPDEINQRSLPSGQGFASGSEKAFSQSGSGSDLSLKEMEKITIMQALLQSENNISEAALTLGMSRSTLYRKIKTYELFNEMHSPR